MRKIVLWVLAAVALLIALTGAPDLIRYLKIRKM